MKLIKPIISIRVTLSFVAKKIPAWQENAKNEWMAAIGIKSNHESEKEKGGLSEAVIFFNLGFHKKHPKKK